VSKKREKGLNAVVAALIVTVAVPAATMTISLTGSAQLAGNGKPTVCAKLG
jgi:hypothetical protein